MEITEAKPLPGYQLELRFNNGERGSVDLSEFVGRGVFKAWRQPGVFGQVAVTSEGAVEWPGEIDMCPDALYLRMTGKKPEDLFPALRNRVAHASNLPILRDRRADVFRRPSTAAFSRAICRADGEDRHRCTGPD